MINCRGQFFYWLSKVSRNDVGKYVLWGLFCWIQDNDSISINVWVYNFKINYTNIWRKVWSKLSQTKTKVLTRFKRSWVKLRTHKYSLFIGVEYQFWFNLSTIVLNTQFQSSLYISTCSMLAFSMLILESRNHEDNHVTFVTRAHRLTPKETLERQWNRNN